VTADTSTWSSLRNPTYLRVGSALVVSGCCVSAHEMAATWAMNSLGAPVLWLSFMSSAATLPLFLYEISILETKILDVNVSAELSSSQRLRIRRKQRNQDQALQA
jgi:hypothetical protein